MLKTRKALGARQTAYTRTCTQRGATAQQHWGHRGPRPTPQPSPLSQCPASPRTPAGQDARAPASCQQPHDCPMEWPCTAGRPFQKVTPAVPTEGHGYVLLSCTPTLSSTLRQHRDHDAAQVHGISQSSSPSPLYKAGTGGRCGPCFPPEFRSTSSWSIKSRGPGPKPTSQRCKASPESTCRRSPSREETEGPGPKAKGQPGLGRQETSQHMSAGHTSTRVGDRSPARPLPWARQQGKKMGWPGSDNQGPGSPMIRTRAELCCWRQEHDVTCS